MANQTIAPAGAPFRLPGRAAEDLVARTLKNMGWRILERNWRAGRFAEIDIIACDTDNQLVFVEVKARHASAKRDDTMASGAEAVSGRKQYKIITAALSYMAHRCTADVIARFDVILVHYSTPDGYGPLEPPTVLHIINAFHGFGW